MESALPKSKKRSQWQEIIPHKENVLLQSVLSYPKNIVLMEREFGLRRLRILDEKGDSERVVSFNDPSYTAYLAANPEYTSTKFYYGYSSMRSPDAIYSVDLQSGRKRKLKQAEIKGPFSPSLYKVLRKEIKARDGTLVPVSIVYRRDLYKKGKNPLFVYGYGSYGISVDAGFSSTRLSLLDRGFIFAIAHVRGGQDLGRKWYEDGKIFNKLNTFYDFIDVTGDVILDGTLNVSLFGGFIPVAGNQFDIIKDGNTTVVGSFATSNFPTGYTFTSGIVGANFELYRLEMLSYTAPTTSSPSGPSFGSVDEVLVLEDNFDSWTVDDIVFTTEESSEEKDEQVLICS